MMLTEQDGDAYEWIWGELTTLPRTEENDELLNI